MAKSSSSPLTLTASGGVFYSSILFALPISHILILWCWGIALAPVGLVSRQNRDRLPCRTPETGCRSGDKGLGATQRGRKHPLYLPPWGHLSHEMGFRCNEVVGLK